MSPKIPMGNLILHLEMEALVLDLVQILVLMVVGEDSPVVVCLEDRMVHQVVLLVMVDQILLVMEMVVAFHQITIKMEEEVLFHQIIIKMLEGLFHQIEIKMVEADFLIKMVVQES